MVNNEIFEGTVHCPCRSESIFTLNDEVQFWYMYLVAMHSESDRKYQTPFDCLCIRGIEKNAPSLIIPSNALSGTLCSNVRI